jgi:hypothetical protein
MSQRSFSRLAWSNLAAQAAEQIMIAASAIAAVVVQAALPAARYLCQGRRQCRPCP